MSETYFLGAVSGGVFRTEFEKIISDRDIFTYILKGGAGTGKSSLMRRVAEHFEQNYHTVRFCCSSDPSSLDAVVIPELHAAICDGTAPHVFEPRYPGVCQRYIDLGSYWDSSLLLASKDRIIEAADLNRSLLARASRFNSAAADICSDIFQTGTDCLLPDKLEAFIGRFEKKLLGKRGSGSGEKSLLRLTALTEHGFLTMHETLENCLDVYVIRDELFTATDHLLSRLADDACARGYDVILSPDQMLSDAAYQHLIIPEEGFAIISGKAAEESRHSGRIRLNLMRFYSKPLLAERSSRLRLDRAAVSDLVSEAVGTIRSAKTAHDQLESYYIPAMDHSKLDALAGELIAEISGRV